MKKDNLKKILVLLLTISCLVSQTIVLADTNGIIWNDDITIGEKKIVAERLQSNDIEPISEVDEKTDIMPHNELTESDNENVTVHQNVDAEVQSAEVSSITEGLQMATMSRTVAYNSNIKIMLDPGHDAKHTGSTGYGLYEENLNLKIALACKRELETYDGVEVYLTRSEDGSCPHPEQPRAAGCNELRVQQATNMGVDVYISLHINSAPQAPNANGVEIYYPNLNYRNDLSEIGKNLSSMILPHIRGLGVNERSGPVRYKNATDGEEYPDGSVADYYGVIKNSKLAGIPGIIVEHAFITNANDVNNFLSREDRLNQLGIADATGIAEFYHLVKASDSTALKLKDIVWNQKDVGIDVGVPYVNRGTGEQFRWTAYNVDKNEWSQIADWNGGNWATWKPQKGNYWLQVEAKNNEGSIDSRIMCFNVQRDYYLGLGTILQLPREDGLGIDLGVTYTAEDSNPQFRWLAYNIGRNVWEEVSGWYSGNWCTWHPARGTYLIQAQIRNSLGQEVVQTIGTEVKEDYQREKINITNMCNIVKDTQIDLGAVYQSNSNVIFRWQAYDLNKKTWSLLADWTGSNWISWKPHSGDYWVYVEGKTEHGVTNSYLLPYHVDTNYDEFYVKANNICILSDSIGINVGVDYKSNDPSVSFTWKMYNCATGEWKTEVENTGANWVTIYPSTGNYWVYVMAKTSDGKTSECAVGCTITARYPIMGNSSYTASRLANYYRNYSPIAYPTFYASSDAPNLDVFCQIYEQECRAEGVNVEVAFAQAMKETGFLKYGGDVAISQYNFAGLGATGGVAGASFSSVREGVRAQVQHLKAYACTAPLNNECVDPRFQFVTRGRLPFVELLGAKENPYGTGWASSENYGNSIVNKYIVKI